MSARKTHFPKKVPPVLATGIGLRAPHVREICEQRPQTGFLEAHSENYFGGGQARTDLISLREDYAISLHGVGLSLGRADGLDKAHLHEIASLVNDIQPLFVSEHLSWSAFGSRHVPDLLPLPMTQEALGTICNHIDTFQQAIGRQILVENPSSYLRFSNQEMTEPEFLTSLVKQTGCGLLLDINNIYVSAHNIGFDVLEYLAAIPAQAVQEMHLAGFQANDTDNGKQIFIDTHGKPVHHAVWELYEQALNIFGDTTTLIEWDTDIPKLPLLLAEAHKADTLRHKIFSTQGEITHAAAS